MALDLADRLRPLQVPLRRRLLGGEALCRMIRAVNASLDPERVGEEIVSHIGDWLPVPAWLVLGVDANGRARALGAQGMTAGLDQVAEAVGHRVLQTGAMFSSADLSADTRLPPAGGWRQEMAAVAFPLEARGRTVGAIVGLDSRPAGRAPRFTPSTLQALLAALEPGALALDNALRVQRAEALSVTDDLTQLYNSRYLFQVLRREIKRAARCGRALSLLFIDLDGFKAVNDAHGHLAGSRALIEAAGVIRASARDTDVVARFGGDEFCIVLPDTPGDGALLAGDRLRARFARHRFFAGEGPDIALTLSVGVAAFPDVSTSAEELIHAADEAMYQVKDRGKNGIHVAVGPPGGLSRSVR